MTDTKRLLVASLATDQIDIGALADLIKDLDEQDHRFLSEQLLLPTSAYERCVDALERLAEEAITIGGYLAVEDGRDLVEAARQARVALAALRGEASDE